MHFKVEKNKQAKAIFTVNEMKAAANQISFEIMVYLRLYGFACRLHVQEPSIER